MSQPIGSGPNYSSASQSSKQASKLEIDKAKEVASFEGKSSFLEKLFCAIGAAASLKNNDTDNAQERYDAYYNQCDGLFKALNASKNKLSETDPEK